MSSSNVFENSNWEEHGSEEIMAVGTTLPDEEDIEMQSSSDDEVENFIDDLNDVESDEDDFDEQEEETIIFSASDDENDDIIEDDDDDGYDFRDALRSAGNFKSKNKKKSASSKSYWKRKMMRSTNRELDPEVRINLSQANEAFVRNDFQVALNLYLEVIKKDPKNFSAYKTLGEICKQQGRLNDCCNYWLLAANIHPWDSQFWANVAELSSDLGPSYIGQAIYCYGKAIAADKTKNLKYILDRAILYKENKQYGRALEGFQRVHQAYPTDTSIIKNLASVYVEQKRLNDAINLYMRILDQNINPTPSNKNIPKFGWAELNILCELYIQQHSWRVGIKVIKLVTRWIQRRSNEKWWDENDDDSEFDKRRFEVIKTLPHDQQAEAKTKFYDLPIDIRYKIGSLRLGLEQKEEAMRHFEFLLLEKEDIADLYFDAGKGLEAHGYYEEALSFLTRASLSEDQSESIELTTLLGKCFLEIGDYQQAVKAYKSVLYDDPTNVEVKLALAETLYHLGDAQLSAKLLEEVRTEHIPVPQESTAPEVIPEEANLSLIKNKQLLKNVNNKLSDEEKIEKENIAKSKVIGKYRRMQRLQDSIFNDDEVAIKAWMQLASQLVDMFMNVRSFFPRDKNRVFKGIVLYRRKKQMGIDEKLARIYNLYDGISNDENYSRLFLSSTTEYRGLNYDEWFIVFVQYAILLFNYEKNYEYATQIIEVAKNVSVFVQDKNKETLLRMLRLLFGIAQDEIGTVVMANVRHFLAANQFSPFIYKFFMCCFSSGIESWETFTNYNHQKFFLRQLKAYDSLAYGKKISGMATITAEVNNTRLTKEHAELLYVYANLLGGSRSYVSSIVYLNRAYKEYNQDPMICLVLGLAHVHRSMQRLSTNRHIQLLQGISYILEYKKIREKGSTVYEAQEIEYNLGRLFHMIGLTTAAIHHYENVFKFHGKLDDESYDLSMESAYNLTLIYNINDNSMLAKEITEKYLKI